jgi:hypothetical protein
VTSTAIYIHSKFVKIGQLFQKLKGEKYRQHDGLIGRCTFLKKTKQAKNRTYGILSFFFFFFYFYSLDGEPG